MIKGGDETKVKRAVRQIFLTTVLVLTGLSQNGVVQAEDDAGSGWGKITEAYVNSEMTVLRLQFSESIVNPGNCEGADFYVRELDDSIASDRFLRVVLAAHLAGRKVKFWIDGCSGSRWWGKTRPQIYDIYIAD
ncbi:MAG: hypothetical protein AMJ59_24590 [Gammaproteobacteria bacterium SG8_31]|nr:MAG: hypothetical protein AMJ59_24590 [Gammaproteobacteria bacterium SG8_31]